MNRDVRQLWTQHGLPDPRVDERPLELSDGDVALLRRCMRCGDVKAPDFAWWCGFCGDVVPHIKATLGITSDVAVCRLGEYDPPEAKDVPHWLMQRRPCGSILFIAPLTHVSPSARETVVESTVDRIRDQWRSEHRQESSIGLDMGVHT